MRLRAERATYVHVFPLISDCPTPFWRQCGGTTLDNLVMDLGYYDDGSRASMVVDWVKMILPCKASVSATWLHAIVPNQYLTGLHGSPA
jgi:hypothetical protein